MMSDPSSITLKERIARDFTEALKARDERRLSALRLLRAEVKKREVSGQKKELTDVEILEVLSSFVKQRRESIRLFAEGGRQDLVEKEEEELRILLSYLPQPLSSAEVEGIVGEVILAAQAKGPKDHGKVMKAVMGRVSGRADGKEVSEKVKEALARLAS